MQSNTMLRDIINTEKLMGNNNNNNNNHHLNNNGSPGTDIMFQMEDDGLTQLGSVFQSAYQSIVGGGAQVRDKLDSVALSGSFSDIQGRLSVRVEMLACEGLSRRDRGTVLSAGWGCCVGSVRAETDRMRRLETSSSQSRRFFTVHKARL